MCAYLLTYSLTCSPTYLITYSAQLCFMLTIVITTLVLLTAIKGRNQLKGIGLTSLPAMFAKGTAMFG